MRKRQVLKSVFQLIDFHSEKLIEVQQTFGEILFRVGIPVFISFYLLSDFCRCHFLHEGWYIQPRLAGR